MGVSNQLNLKCKIKIIKKILNRITAEEGVGVDVTIQYLDIDPQTDFLYFRGGDKETTTESGPVLTGSISSPKKYRIVHTNKLYVHFASNSVETQNYKGFLLSYAPYGNSTPTTEAPTTLPVLNFDEIDSISVSIILPTTKRNTVTYDQFREILAAKANAFMIDYNISAVAATVEDVVFPSVRSCSQSWPNSGDCLHLEFAIPVELKDLDLDDLDQPAYELNSTNLWIIWNDYAQEEFATRGFVTYQKETTSILLMWIGISFGIIIVFLVVLYGISKMDFVQEYRRMSTGKDDTDYGQKKESFNVSMYPNPYQIAPSLFPEDNVGPYNLPQFVIDDRPDSEPINSRISIRPMSRTSFSEQPLPERPISSTSFKTLPSSPSYKSHSPGPLSFAPDVIDFNETHSGNTNMAYEPDDIELKFDMTPSPRTKERIFLRGMNADESMS